MTIRVLEGTRRYILLYIVVYRCYNNACVAAHDTNVYIFKGKWIWRVDDYYGVNEGFPKLIRKIYESPPKNIGGAVYSWKTRFTYFFKGNGQSNCAQATN